MRQIYLTMLHGFVIVEGIQFNSLVRDSTVLVLSGVLSNPEMEVVLQIFLIRVPGTEVQLIDIT